MNGIDLVTATSLAMAAVVLKSIDVKGVIVCKDSWSESEREEIFAEVSKLSPGVSVVMRCIGCTGCDEAAGTAGIMIDSAPVVTFISAVTAAKS